MLQYIDQPGAAALKTFGYIGSNLSLSYRYIWGPLADFLLKYVPQNIAPNSLTMAGFLCVVVGHLLVVLSGEFGDPIPRAVLVAFALLMLIYQTLDNLDGKQARKTKTSSPLGMLFDHGSDSLSSFLIGVSVLKILSITNRTLMLFIIITHVLSVFFCAIWSQYNTNNFELGTINPVDDGIPTVAVVALLNCFIPEDFWTRKLFISTVNIELIMFLIIPLFLILTSFTKNTLSQTKNTKNQTIKHAVQPLLVLGILSLVYFFAPDGYLDHNFFPLIYTIGFLWSRNIILMQLNYVTKGNLNIWNYPFLVYILGHIGMLVYSNMVDCSPESLHAFAIGMCLLQVGFWTEFVLSVMLQMKNILKIQIFSIGSQVKGTKAEGM